MGQLVSPVKKKEDLLKLRPFVTELYSRYALTSLAAYGVFWLQEWNITTSLENLAVACQRMFPVKFGMVGWPQFPDINRINRSVLQMRPKYRNLATSSPRKGVFLNQNGLAEATAISAKLGPPLFEGEASSGGELEGVRAERGRSAKPRTLLPENLLEQARESELYRLHSASQFDEAEAIHLIDMLRVYDHTPSREKRRQLRELVEAAQEVGDREMGDFLGRVGERFARYLNR